MGSDVINYLEEIPVVTRTWSGGVVLLTLLVTTGIVPHWIFFPPKSFVMRQIMSWTQATQFLWFGKLDLNWLFRLYFFISYGGRLEKSEAMKDSTGYTHFVVSLMLIVNCLCFATGTSNAGTSSVFALIYVWSRLNPDSRVSIYGFEIDGWWVPPVFLFITFLMGGDVVSDINGAVAGHISYFLVDILRREHKFEFIPRRGKVHITKFLDGLDQLEKDALRGNVRYDILNIFWVKFTKFVRNLCGTQFYNQLYTKDKSTVAAKEEEQTPVAGFRVTADEVRAARVARFRS